MITIIEGINGGYILKLSIKCPSQKSQNERWNPQMGQSIPNNDFEAQGNKIGLNIFNKKRCKPTFTPFVFYLMNIILQNALMHLKFHLK